MLLPLVDFHVSASVGQWGMLATLGVLHTGLMYVLMYGALQKLPTNLIGSLSFIYPVAAMLVDCCGVWPPPVGVAAAGRGDHSAGGGGHEPAGRAASAAAAGLGRPARRLMLRPGVSTGAIRWCG